MSENNGQARKPAGKWPWIIVGLLGGHVTIMVIAVMIATHDRSFSVVPNYYQRALNWDQTQAELRASEKLGWRVQVEASNRVDPIGQRAVTFLLTDATGKPIDGAAMEVEYFHDAHGDEEKQVKLSCDPKDPTRFTASLPMRYAGQWEFSFTVRAEGKTFVAHTTRFLENAKNGGRA